jgi:hypothetical protein
MRNIERAIASFICPKCSTKVTTSYITPARKFDDVIDSLRVKKCNTCKIPVRLINACLKLEVQK